MTIITETLDIDHIMNIMDKDGYITVILPVHFSVLKNYDADFFLNYISNKILGDLTLLDIHITLKGIYEENLLFLIKGNVSIFLAAKMKEGVIDQ